MRTEYLNNDDNKCDEKERNKRNTNVEKFQMIQKIADELKVQYSNLIDSRLNKIKSEIEKLDELPSEKMDYDEIQLKRLLK